MNEPEEITRDEWAVLYSLLNDRQIQAESEGINLAHPSSVFRLRLLDKLVAFREPIIHVLSTFKTEGAEE